MRLGGSASCVPEDAQIASLHGCVPLSLGILISCRFLIPERSEITGAFLTVFGVGVLGITQGVYKMALVSFSLPQSPRIGSDWRLIDLLPLSLHPSLHIVRQYRERRTKVDWALGGAIERTM